jgi:hypothetical protein
MNRFVKLQPYVAAVAVTATIALVVMPAPVTNPSATDVPHDELRRADELERRRIACAGRQEIRDHIIRDVIAGRLSLEEAGERFQQLNEADPHFSWAVFRAAYPGATDDERCRRQVIAFVRIDLEDEPSRSSVIGKILERELDGHLAKSSLRQAQ